MFYFNVPERAANVIGHWSRYHVLNRRVYLVSFMFFFTPSTYRMIPLFILASGDRNRIILTSSHYSSKLFPLYSNPVAWISFFADPTFSIACIHSLMENFLFFCRKVLTNIMRTRMQSSLFSWLKWFDWDWFICLHIRRAQVFFLEINQNLVDVSA